MWSIMVILIWFISILLLIIYWCWVFFTCKMYLDSGCLYRDCFMYLQPRISFQPRVVLNREQGIFGMWGDMKIVTAWWIIICLHRYLCPVCSRRWWIFLQTNTESVPNYLKIFWTCLTKFQPRLTEDEHDQIIQWSYVQLWKMIDLSLNVQYISKYD